MAQHGLGLAAEQDPAESAPAMRGHDHQADAVIGTEKILGKELSDPVPAKDWAAAARKEAVWLTFRAAGKRELLDRLTATKFGSAWRIKAGDSKPVPLRDWLIEHHTPTKEVAGSP